MTYTLIEMQTNGDTTAIVQPIHESWTDHDTAVSEWHFCCGYAAKSSVEIHSVLLISGDGRIVEEKVFRHPAQTPAAEDE